MEYRILTVLPDTYAGDDLVLNVALEAVHLRAFLGIGHHAV